MYPIYHHLLTICEDAKKAPLESISQRMRLHPSTNPPTWRDPRIAWLSATIGHRESWGLRYDWKDGSSMSVEILKNVFIAALATNCHCNSWILWGSSRAPFHNCRHVPFLQWENDMQKWIAHHFSENIKANGSDISKSKRYWLRSCASRQQAAVPLCSPQPAGSHRSTLTHCQSNSMIRQAAITRHTWMSAELTHLPTTCSNILAPLWPQLACSV